MGFVYKSAKKPPPRSLLTAQEEATAQIIYDALRKSSNSISLADIENMLANIDATRLSNLMDAVSISGSKDAIIQSLIDNVDFGGTTAISDLAKIAPKILIPAFIPDAVEILNAPHMANMDFTKIPEWARPNPPKIKFDLAFNRTNPLALKFAQNRAGELITSIDDLTRQSIRQIISDSFAQQLDIRATAKRIKSTIGLHPRWADAVVKYQDRAIARGLKAGQSELKSRAVAQTQTDAYSARLLQARATMIARTEVQIAQNEGRYEGWQQASDAGFLPAESNKMWIIAKDERTCPICLELNGEIVGWNESFSNGDEMPPAHPQCRCTSVIIPPAVD